ncbi:MAG: Hedgehog/intein hint domain protein [Blastococcus sp.]|nr:Hedgehog/intein hint domain protein [Blastococcus sp.]
MRWDAQRLDLVEPTTLPGMPSIRGLLRSVQVPEFPGLTFHEVRAKSALNHVPGESAMPFPWTINPYRGCSHSCVYCLHGDTLVLMADGSQRPIADLRVGDQIVGTERRGTSRHYVTTEVHAHWSTVKPGYRVTLADGTEIVASADHRFLTDRGWKYVTGAMSGPGSRPHLTSDDAMMGFGRTLGAAEACGDLRRGHLTGMVRGETTPEVHRSERAGRSNGDVHRFDLALADVDAADRTQAHLDADGVQAEGSRGHAVLRIRDADGDVLDQTRKAFTEFEDVRLRGGLRERLRFRQLVDPAIRRKRGVEGIAVRSNADLRVVSVQSLGVDMPMYDITTGTGDFVANGVISHNCFARKTHEWLEMDTGRDFDSQIVVKTNLVEVLRRELGRPSWQREHVALGTNTDPYQRAEGRYTLMPGVITALADSGTPFSILTKGTLLRRDIPLLVEASHQVPVGIGVSMAIWDDALHTALEPGVPTPRARLELVRAVTGAGLPCGVFLAPVLPGLTDSTEALDAAIGAIAAAGATGVTVIPLHLRPGAREWFMAWLARDHQELVPRYERLYARRAYVPAEYRTWLAQRVAPLLAAHGLDRQSGGAARQADGAITAGVPGEEEVGFPTGSLPTGGLPGIRPKGQTGTASVGTPAERAEQLSLL